MDKKHENRLKVQALHILQLPFHQLFNVFLLTSEDTFTNFERKDDKKARLMGLTVGEANVISHA
jgi:hypothetical protein